LETGQSKLRKMLYFVACMINSCLMIATDFKLVTQAYFCLAQVV